MLKKNSLVSIIEKNDKYKSDSKKLTVSLISISFQQCSERIHMHSKAGNYRQTIRYAYAYVLIPRREIQLLQQYNIIQWYDKNS